MDNFKMIRGQDPPLKGEEKEGKGREGAGASIPQRAMRQYSPPIFQSLKGVSFLPLLMSFEAESLGMGWGKNVVRKLTTLGLGLLLDTAFR
jgi:hypothetical protein